METIKKSAFILFLLCILFSTTQAQEAAKGEGSISISPTEFHFTPAYEGSADVNIYNPGTITQNVTINTTILQGGGGWPVPPETVQMPGGAAFTMYIAVDSVEIQNPSEPYKMVTFSAYPADTTIEVFIYKDITESIPETQMAVFSVYPNPAESVLFIDGGNTGDNFCIMDLTGESRLKAVCKGDKTMVDLEGLPAGIYLIRNENPAAGQCLKFIKR